VHALSAGGNGGNHADAQRRRQTLDIQSQPASLGFVHHIERQQQWNTHFCQLHGEMQRAPQVLGITDLHNRLELVFEQHAGGHLLVFGAGRESDNAGGVKDDQIGRAAGFSLSELDRRAGIVGDGDVPSGQAVKKQGFAHIGVADQSNAPPVNLRR